MRRSILSIAALTTVATACASAGPPVPASTLPACSIAGAPAQWRVVVDRSARFCVPADWTVQGERARSGSGSEITWGTSPPRAIRSSVTTVTGAQRPTQAQLRAQLGMQEVHRATETIGGDPVDLFINVVDGDFFSGASWPQGTTWSMRGEASTEGEAREHLIIYRTVRRN